MNWKQYRRYREQLEVYGVIQARETVAGIKVCGKLDGTEKYLGLCDSVLETQDDKKY